MLGPWCVRVYWFAFGVYPWNRGGDPSLLSVSAFCVRFRYWCRFIDVGEDLDGVPYSSDGLLPDWATGAYQIVGQVEVRRQMAVGFIWKVACQDLLVE